MHVNIPRFPPEIYNRFRGRGTISDLSEVAVPTIQLCELTPILAWNEIAEGSRTGSGSKGIVLTWTAAQTDKYKVEWYINVHNTLATDNTRLFMEWEDANGKIAEFEVTVEGTTYANFLWPFTSLFDGKPLVGMTLRSDPSNTTNEVTCGVVPYFI